MSYNSDANNEPTRRLTRLEARDLAIRMEICGILQEIVDRDLCIYSSLKLILAHLLNRSATMPFSVYYGTLEIDTIYDRSTFAVKRDGLALFGVPSEKHPHVSPVVAFHQPHRVILFQNGPIQLPLRIEDWGFLGRWIQDHAWRQLKDGHVYVVGIEQGDEEWDKSLNALLQVIGFVGGRLLLRGDNAGGDPFADDGVLGLSGERNDKAWLFGLDTFATTRTVRVSDGQVKLEFYQPTA